MERLRVRKATHDDLLAVNAAQAAVASLPATARPSQVEKALRPFSARTLFVVRAFWGYNAATPWLDDYMTSWRQVKTAVSGHDLRAIGLKPGPAFAIILDELLAARLDGVVTSEAEERVLMAKLAENAKGQIAYQSPATQITEINGKPKA